MLLKRIETNGEVKALYESSNILASTYKEATNELILIFKHGGQYKYSDVSASDYFKFEMADSQGKVFNGNIKPKTTETLEKVDPKSVEKEIDSFKVEDANTFKLGIIKAMDNITEVYSKTDDVNIVELDNLTAMIDRYKEALANQPATTNA